MVTTVYTAPSGIGSSASEGPNFGAVREVAESGQGSGKGGVEYLVAPVKPGRVMFEMAGVPEETAREAMRLAAHKLPVKCKFIKKADDAENQAEGGEV